MLALITRCMVALLPAMLAMQAQAEQRAAEPVLAEVQLTVRTTRLGGDVRATNIHAGYGEWTFASTDRPVDLATSSKIPSSATIPLTVDSTNLAKKTEVVRWLRRNEVEITFEDGAPNPAAWSYSCAILCRFSDGSETRQAYTTVTRPSGTRYSQCGAPEAAAAPSSGGQAAGAATCEGRYQTYINGDAAYVCESGKIAIQPSRRLGAAGNFRENRATIYVDGKYGFIDEAGQIVIQPQFGFASDFSEGLAAVKTAEAGVDGSGLPRVGKTGFIDKSGKMVIRPTFEFAGDFKNGLAYAKTSAGVGFIDRTGSFVIQPQFKAAGDFSEGLAPVMRANQWGYVDAGGKLAISYRFQEAGAFSEGLAAVTTGDHGGFIDKTGKLVIPARFGSDVFSTFSGGLARVRVGEKVGFIDRTGNIVIPPRFSNAGNFANGLAAVEIEDLWGYIDPQGKVVIQPRFTDARPFDSLGIAGVSTTAQVEAYIDKTGRAVWVRPQ